jgi:predicted permease
MMRRWLRIRLSPLLRRARHERELDLELRFHLDMLADQNIRAGMSPEDARRAALRTFGHLDGIKAEVRDTWLSRLADTVIQDLRGGLRNLRKHPGFAVTVILTMALGIGANTAVFSVVNGVLLRPLPYRDGHQLVVLRQQAAAADLDDLGFSATEIADYRARSRSLAGVVEFHNMWFILLGGPEPQRLSTGVVSPNFFDVLGVTPLHGRTFTRRDDAHGAEAVLVLSHGYWQRAFGGDPSVVGRVFQMNDRPHQVIGILPPVPQYPLEVDVYMPTSACPFRSAPAAAMSRGARMLTAFGRLRDGVSLGKARADLAVVATAMQQEFPEAYPRESGYTATASPLREELTRSFNSTMAVLMGTAAFVLLIVCASVANLMLARLARRRYEMSVRSVLGASRSRLARQLLTESTVLAVLGGAAGLIVAQLGMRVLVAFAERFTTRAAEIQIDGRVLLYTLGVSVATGLIFGALPAFGEWRGRSPLPDGTRVTHDRRNLRNTLIVVQIAASFMLLIGAGLTIRSLIKLHQLDPGFRTDNILTMRIDLNFTKYGPALRSRFWQRLEERLLREPGVITVGGGATFPLNELGPFSQSIQIEGRPVPENGLRPLVDARLATPDYFTTIGQPILAGRPFRGSDRSFYVPADVVEGDREFAVIVNQTMARHYWPNEDPIGRRLTTSNNPNWATVVGVVADARQQLDQPSRDEIYVPLLTGRQLSTTWLVRTNVEPSAMERRIRAIVRALDPDQPVDNFRTLAEVRSESLEQRTLTATLLGLFGLLALAITATGIAGVVAFSVSQRTREFGVRMALGARRADVVTMVLRQGLQLVLIGLALGLAGALVLTRLLSTLLFGIEPTDGLTFVAVSMVLIAVAALACFVPARRAASVDPLVALRVG